MKEFAPAQENPIHEELTQLRKWAWRGQAAKNESGRVIYSETVPNSVY